MHIFDLIFWTFFAGTLGFIAWSFLRAIICAIAGRRPGTRASPPPLESPLPESPPFDSLPPTSLLGEVP